MPRSCPPDFRRKVLDLVESGRRSGLVLRVVVGLVPVGWDVTDCGMEALVVESVDPFCGGEFDVGDVGKAVPGPAGN